MTPPAGCIIRLAEPRDAPGVAAVHVSSWRRTFQDLLPVAKLEELTVEGATARWADCFAPGKSLGRAGETIWVLEREGSVVGFTAVGPCRDEVPVPPEVGELYALYVDPRVWAQGLGTVLLHHVIGHLQERRQRRVMLWIVEGNDHAHRFALRHGFAPDGAAKLRPRGDVQLRELRYAKDLIP